MSKPAFDEGLAGVAAVVFLGRNCNVPVWRSVRLLRDNQLNNPVSYESFVDFLNRLGIQINDLMPLYSAVNVDIAGIDDLFELPGFPANEEALVELAKLFGRPLVFCQEDSWTKAGIPKCVVYPNGDLFVVSTPLEVVSVLSERS